ncbi:MAG: hypothetical protein CMJ72_00820 [Planctomycetaceae bacterium]|nr:hypothetical protein [Planctomycetaceae bacterium]
MNQIKTRYKNAIAEWRFFDDLAKHPRRKYSREIKASMKEFDWTLEPFEGKTAYPLTHEWCPHCGTVLRMFYEGYEEEAKKIEKSVLANAKKTDQLEQEVQRLTRKLEKLKVDDKKAREKAKKKKLKDQTEAEIAELQKRLDALKQEEE